MQRGFTLVEVLVALVIVALGLAALMVAVSGAARTSGYLRDKTLAQWIALNRLTEVRLTVNKLGDTGDTAEIRFANRTWHYDTRYFDTTIPNMKRVVVRVWEGDAKTKGNPVAESTSFLGAALGLPGMSNVDWTVGSTAATAVPCPSAPAAGSSTAGGGSPIGGAAVPGSTNCIPSSPTNGASTATPTAPSATTTTTTTTTQGTEQATP
jgi:general secretion pathway protein I